MAAAAPLDDGVEQVDEAGELVRDRFHGFLDSFSSGAAADGTPLLDYHGIIRAMVDGEASTVTVDFKHIMDDDIELAEAIEVEYYRFSPFIQRAVQAFVARDYPDYVGADLGRRREFFVAFYNMPNVERVRQLKADHIGRLAAVSGTVTRTSDVRPELVVGAFICSKCGLATQGVEQQFKFTEPAICRNSTCQNTNEWELDARRSRFVDWQRLRVQENADEIPPGSMPRSLDVVLRGDAVERVKAGDKVIFTGTLIVLPDAGGFSRGGESAVGTSAPGKRSEGGMDSGLSGLKKLGARELTYKTAFLACSALPAEQASGGYNIRDDAEDNQLQVDVEGEEVNHKLLGVSEEDRAFVREMSRTPGLYEKMVNSIAPTVFGHGEVKRGVLLMLLGGVHKQTPEGIKLRGDLNVCVVGDPSTAKSQFLKYVHGFLPRAVFASGKASSAAGLTASVVRDHETGEFGIEAGALMLADNGICCIDEFDKMDIADQVAIHEAMEQQTISITKAGIQATLNARTSILAAANPLFGRYDRSKTLRANVQISAPIMSRFDLFFVVLDECEEEADEAIARHILRVHQGQDEAIRPPFTQEELQRYIRYARRLDPEISEAGQSAMVECYRALRQNDCLGRGRSAYRITVRQLESMVRLSEALARLHLDTEVRPSYVREAYRLLRKSIIHVESDEVVLEEEDDDFSENDLLRQGSGGGGGGGGGSGGGGGGESDDGDKGNARMDIDAGPAADRFGAGGEENGVTSSQTEVSPEETGEEVEQPRAGGGVRHHGGGDETDLENTQLSDEEVAATMGGDGQSQRSQRTTAEPEAGEEDSQGQYDAESSQTQREEKSRKKRKKKQRRQITYEAYRAITNAVATYVRHLEDVGSAPFAGARWGAVVDWYVTQQSEEARDEGGDSETRALANLVVTRLINNDNVLVYVGEEEIKKQKREDRLLAVHPNYAAT